MSAPKWDAAQSCAASSGPRLLAVPNISEGADPLTLGAVGAALARADHGVRLHDVHSDPDHNRSVYTLSGPPGSLAPAVLAGAAEAIRRIDISAHEGVHPRTGALDVAPIVYARAQERGAACAEALVLADLLGERLDLPVFLYGILTEGRRTRADVRRGGPAALARRIAEGELVPDFGPRAMHPTAGAVLVGARAPLLAFNVEIEPPATLQDAQRIARAIREGGSEAVPRCGRSACGSRTGISRRFRRTSRTTTGRPSPMSLPPLRVTRVRHGLSSSDSPPSAAFEGFPEDLPLVGKRVLEEELGIPAESPTA